MSEQTNTLESIMIIDQNELNMQLKCMYLENKKKEAERSANLKKEKSCEIL